MQIHSECHDLIVKEIKKTTPKPVDSYKIPDA